MTASKVTKTPNRQANKARSPVGERAFLDETEATREPQTHDPRYLKNNRRIPKINQKGRNRQKQHLFARSRQLFANDL